MEIEIGLDRKTMMQLMRIARVRKIDNPKDVLLALIKEANDLPLFMLKRKYFDLIKEGKKDVEIRPSKGRSWKNAKIGDTAVFMCSKNLERKTIKAIHKGTLEQILSTIDYKRIMPNAENEKEAINTIRALYPNETEFVAFEL